MSTIKPFIRWAGGKTWLIKHIHLLINNIQINHYHEPFLGGAAIFFSLNIKKMSYLSDVNIELIETYIAIKHNPKEVINILESFKNNEEEYYQIRAMKPSNKIECAARFIYLNQASYNGLYRVNQKGDYNVPYGFRKNTIYNTDRILNASKKLQKTNIMYGDFTINKYKIQQGDLIFLDPPYTVSHNNNGFIEYNKNLFLLDDQIRLSQYINYIKRKKAYYILTNAAHNTIREIFNNDDQIFELSRHSLIGGKNSDRKKVKECIFTNITGGRIND